MTEFVQGQTRRWGIAWSFTNEHIPDVGLFLCVVFRMSKINLAFKIQSFGRLSVHPNNSLYSFQPPHNTLSHHFHLSFTSIDTQYLQTVLLGTCRTARVLAYERPIILEEEEHPKAPLTTFRMNPNLLQANANTWSRKERRKQGQGQKDRQGGREGSVTPQTRATLMCSTQWLFDFTTTPADVILESQWVFGDDRRMFEGLIAHIVKKVTQALEPYAPRTHEFSPPGMEGSLSEVKSSPLPNI